MLACRATIASAACLLALSSGVAGALGEPATTIARLPPTASTSAAVTEVIRFPPGCAIAAPAGRNGSQWFLPRASLVVTNRSPHRVTLRMEARLGVEAAGTESGPIEPGETRTFRNVVPAGRSVALAQRYESGATYARQPIYIWNYGPFTCRRRFIWVLR
jgi:hypothetical protein